MIGSAHATTGHSRQRPHGAPAWWPCALQRGRSKGREVDASTARRAGSRPGGRAPRRSLRRGRPTGLDGSTGGGAARPGDKPGGTAQPADKSGGGTAQPPDGPGGGRHSRLGHRRRASAPARPQRPAVSALRRHSTGRAAGDRPHHHAHGRGEGFHDRHWLRGACLDLQRASPRPRDPRPLRRHGAGPSDQPRHQYDAPLARFPRQPSRLERADAIGQPGARQLVHLACRLRWRLDVPLRHGSRDRPHRQWHVRHGDRGAQGRAAQGGQGVHHRAERVVFRRPRETV
jgi:hypothetical protein